LATPKAAAKHELLFIKTDPLNLKKSHFFKNSDFQNKEVSSDATNGRARFLHFHLL
jgi:hypothetical protein